MHPGIHVGAGFLLGTAGVKAVTSKPAKKAYVKGIVCGMKAKEPADSWATAPRPRHLFAQLANMAVTHFVRRALLPSPIRRVVNLYQALPCWRAALRSLRAGRLDVPVLDGAAIAMGLLRGTGSAGSTIFLLNVGEALEDFTQRRGEAGLARSLLDIPARAHVQRDGAEIELDIADLHEGDVVVARLGDPIPVDGEVVSGEAAVNQSSLTGEPLAVVQAALDEGLEHRERHAAVEYVVAHGIASLLDGARVVIGSEHFVLEDEGVPVPAAELAHIHEQACGTSPLFLAVDGQLRGIIYVNDPLKAGAADVVRQLYAEGFARVIMITGDNERTAARVAAEAGIDEYRADLLPEHKHALVEELQAQGHKVAMVGDGVNDSPALAAARVSVAMSGGSAVAREAADITLASDDLSAIVELRRLSRVLQKRLNSGYRFTVAFNSALLALGIAGVLTPQMSSALHNGSTVALSASHARPFLPAGESEGR